MDVSHALSLSVAVIRSYKNTHVTKRVRDCLDAGFGHVIVVTNNAQDKGSTRGWLKAIRDDRLQLIEIAEGYTWSTALNTAAKTIKNTNRFAQNPYLFVFNVSVEAKFKTDHIRQLMQVMLSDESMAVVGTTFDGRFHGRPYKLGPSYQHPRNTGMLIRLEALEQEMGFNASCDGMGGMEDIDFVLALLVTQKWKYSFLDLQVELILDAHWEQNDKEKREQEAMRLIIAYWRELCPAGGPEIDRINTAVAKMGLES